MANLRIAELDFDTIKTNLKTFMKAQTEFSDYDFEGSGLSTLIDLLAYNTHYNAYLANMLVNEMFMDSAVKRTSAVSIAKHLGYTPRSVRGAVASINVSVNSPTGSPSTLTMARYTPFSTTINGTALTFVNLNPITISPSGGAYTFSELELKEGQNFEYKYTVANPGPSEKFEIPAENIDTTTLRVIVQNSSSDSTQTVYSLYSDLSIIESDSLVYYLEENNNGRYQVFFGDNVLGKKLTAGNIVILQYLVSSGTDSNVSNLIDQSFTLTGTIEGNNNVTITVNDNSTGGAEKETLTEIKFNSVRQFTTQNRAVTAEDYKSIILTNYPLAESIAVWGGEDNNPPIYGKLLISMKPYEGYVISNTTKESIKNDVLASKKAMGIQIEFVDPEYFYVNLVATVKYNSRNTTLSKAQIEGLATTAIQNYFNNNLEKFDADFYYSKLTSAMDVASSAIVGSLLSVSLQKRIEPTLNVSNSFTGTSGIRFNNFLHPYGLSSTRFNIVSAGVTTPVIIKDSPNDSPINYNGTGTLRLINPITNQVVSTNIGSVNYATGLVTIDSLVPVGYPSGQTDLRITAELQEASYDISVSREQIIVLDDSTLDALANRLAGLTVNAVDVAL